MSKYTTQLRYICESLAGYEESTGYNNIDDVVTKAIPKIFDFDFPIFDESYRVVLEREILKHFYFREIGCETYGMWKHYLNEELNEIMPEMNKYYESTLYEFNPLYATDIQTKRNRTTKGENQTINSSTTDNESGSQMTDKYSDTPQGGLSNIQNDTYLTNARIDNETSASSSTTDAQTDGTFKDTETYGETVQGYNGWSPSRLIEDFRKQIINVDLMVMKRLEPLFMQIW